MVELTRQQKQGVLLFLKKLAELAESNNMIAQALNRIVRTENVTSTEQPVAPEGTPPEAPVLQKEYNMKSFLELYTEAKQVGTLYYYTKFELLFDIIKQNQLTRTDKVPYVSFTRDKNFHAKGQYGSVVNECRFIIGGDKLSTKYRLNHTQEDEQEERVEGPVKNLNQYIIKLQIFKQALENLFKDRKQSYYGYENANQFVARLEQYCKVELI